MRTVALFLGTALGAAAHAQSALDAQCTNATETLNSVAFPLDLPFETKSGEATVDFTIGSDGTIGDAIASSYSDPAFAWPAVAAVKRLTCVPRAAPEKYSLPISFTKPIGLSESLCPNFKVVMQGFDYPQRAFRRGITRGSATFEFTLQPSGRVANLVVLRASNEDFATEGLRALGELKCNPTDHHRQVRVPMGFKIE